MKTYGSQPEEGDGGDVEIGIAEYAVTANGVKLSTFGLGSCVAVAIHDGEAGVSGLAHVMLPSDARSGDSVEDVGKYADTAIKAMVAEMEEAGANRESMEAKIAGGSEMFDFSGIAEGVGRRNVEATRNELEALGIPIEAADVGGDYGRSIEFDGETGALKLKTADEDKTEL